MNLSQMKELSPAEFETLSGYIMQKLGYEVKLIKSGEDIGIDIIARKGAEILAIQVKKYIRRKINLSMIYHTYGAATYYKCTKAIIITLSDLTLNAIDAAGKLNVEIWGKEKLIALLNENEIDSLIITENQRFHAEDWFHNLWNIHIKGLEGTSIKHLTRDTFISIINVDDDGITIINSNNRKRSFEIDIFKQVLTKLRMEGFITREEINDDYQRRGSSAISAILATIPGVTKKVNTKKTTLTWEI